MSNDEPTLNNKSLDDLFNLSTNPSLLEPDPLDHQMVEDMRNQLPALTSDQEPDTILYKNIEKANKLLDKVYENVIDGGNINARLVEVCGQLINAITTATSSIAGNSFAQQKSDYNMKMVEVKQQEVEVKKIIATNRVEPRQGGGEQTEKKVLVMDRETLLKMMEEEKKEVHVESYVPLHKTD